MQQAKIFIDSAEFEFVKKRFYLCVEMDDFIDRVRELMLILHQTFQVIVKLLTNET